MFTLRLIVMGSSVATLTVGVQALNAAMNTADVALVDNVLIVIIGDSGKSGGVTLAATACRSQSLRQLPFDSLRDVVRGP
jgi:hypothetical protein